MTLEQKPDIATTGYRLSPASSFTLDFIRAVAAQAVLVGHSISLLGLIPWLQPPHFAYIQNIAVVVFFLLSGLLISYSVLSRPERPSFGAYLIDRFARIYSGLIPALVIVALCDAAAIAMPGGSYQFFEGFSIIDFVGNLAMLQDYPGIGSMLGITSFGSARVLWTLAVEWWLYMAFGWLVLARPSGAKFWLGLLVLAPVAIFNLVAGRGGGLTAMWLVGCCGFMVLRSGMLTRINFKTGWYWLACLTIVAGARLMVTRDAYDFLFAALTGAALTLLIAQLDARSWSIPPLLQRAVKFTADYSFTLYLIHLSTINLLLQFTQPANPVVTFWVLFIAANVIAAALALKTEMQHHRLRSVLRRRFAHVLAQ